MLDKRSQLVIPASLPSAASDAGCSSESKARADQSPDEPPDRLPHSNPDQSAYCDSEKIYLPSFATEQALLGRYAYARQLFDCWIEAKSEAEDYRVFFNRAICNYELEDYEQALADVDVAIRLRDKWPKGECTLSPLHHSLRCCSRRCDCCCCGC